MIPVFSWIMLRGRCRSCKARIPVRYPAAELLGAVMAVLSLVYFGSWNGYWYELTPQAVLVFGLISLLTVISLLDHDTMEIPNGLVLACMVPAAAAVFAFPSVTLPERCIGFFCVSAVLFLITLAVPGAFGGGDIKLMAVLGFYLGWKMCLTAFFLAILAGGAYGIFLMAFRKRSGKDHFAFGPFLCAGTAAAVFWGEPLLEWYLRIFF